MMPSLMAKYLDSIYRPKMYDINFKILFHAFERVYSRQAEVGHE